MRTMYEVGHDPQKHTTTLGGIDEGLVADYSGVVTGSGNDLMIIQADTYSIALSSLDESIGTQLATVPGDAESPGDLLLRAGGKGDATAQSRPLTGTRASPAAARAVPLSPPPIAGPRSRRIALAT